MIPANDIAQNTSKVIMNMSIKVGAKKVEGIYAKNLEAMFSNAIPVLIFL